MSLYKNQPQGMRQRRVAEQIQRLLAESLTSGKVYFPELDGLYIGIAAVEISPDLKHAKIFLSLPSDVDARDLCRFFDGKKNVFQGLIAKQLKLKFVPVLKFLEDTFQAQSDRTEELFHDPRVQKDIAKQDDDEDSDDLL